MKNKKMGEKLISILLIFIMLFSYFPMFVFANDTDNGTTEDEINMDEYIEFNAIWEKNGGNSLDAYTSESYELKYNIVTKDLEDGFRNVTLNISNKNDGTPLASIKSNENPESNGINNYSSYSSIYFGELDKGNDISGTSKLMFFSNGEKYSKEIIVTLTGSYRNPITKEETTFKIDRTLSAEVTPATQYTEFFATVQMQRNDNGFFEKESIKHLGDKIEAYYPIKIESYYYTQKSTIKITINETFDDENLLYQGYEIDWDGLDTKFGQPTKSEPNRDGSITYTFTIGNDTNTFDKNNRLTIDEEFNIKITYNVDLTKYEFKPIECSFIAEINSSGWEVEKEFGKDEVTNLVSKKNGLNKNNTVYYHEGDGTESWAEIYKVLVGEMSNSIADNLKGGNPYSLNEKADELLNNGTTEISIYNMIKHVDGQTSNDALNGIIKYGIPELSYITDNGDIATIQLNSDQIRLKEIVTRGTAGGVNLVYTEGDVEKTIEDITTEKLQGLNISNFNIEIENFLRLLNRCSGIGVTYTLNRDSLYNNGVKLTDTEIANITSLTISNIAYGDQFYAGGNATYYNPNSVGNQLSYMELNIGEDFSTEISNTESETKTIKLEMYKNENVIKSEGARVYNVNPKFYVKLNSAFNYNFATIKATMPDNNYIRIVENEIALKKIDGEIYLVIPCEGIYDSLVMPKTDISVTFERTLKNKNVIGVQTIDAYMITDNELYVYETANELGLVKGETTPDSVFHAQEEFSIIGDGSAIRTYTGIQDINNWVIEPNPSNDIDEEAEIGRPLIIDSGKTVKYQSGLQCSGEETLSNITIISRLPKAGNANIIGNSKKLINDDYELPDSFYDLYGNKVKDLTKGTPVTQVSLENLRNIKVYEQNGITEISKDYYTIYYSNDADATLTTGTFYEYEEGVSDVSNATTIKVVFDKTVSGEVYKLNSGNSIIIQYEMTMPDQAGMVGAVTAVQYTKSSGNQSVEIESSSAYVVNGDTRGNIQINKIFEGFEFGTAPEGIELSGIQFKLKYVNELETESDEINQTNNYVTGPDGNDLIATTNSDGIATFNNIDSGTYMLEEITEFDNYDGITDTFLITVEPAENETVEVENKIKRNKNLTITKIWENTEEQQGTVEFTVERTNSDNISYSKTVETDSEGKAVLSKLPYGNYTITESRGIAGWKPKNPGNSSNPAVFNVTINQDYSGLLVENELDKGTLKIVKTVPEGEDVAGLKFHITGIGMVSYIDTDGNTVTNNEDFTVQIPEDSNSYTYTEDNKTIVIEKTDNNTKATITISNLYFGLYTVEEIDIPTIDVNGTPVIKYVSEPGQVDLNNSYTPVFVNIDNRYKTGILKIQKTAKFKAKDGDTDRYVDIGDLSSFTVNVSGKSSYGKDINTTVSLDVNGFGEVQLPIGEYTIEEVAQDGYTAYYGEDLSTEPPTVKITNNSNITQKIYNEHTGVGYVRVEKTLEGVVEPEKVVNANIKFRVYGKNIVGEEVSEVIEINQIDTQKGVAYGVSGPISSGGDYQLEEIETPDFYEGIDPIEIELSTLNTTESPLVIQVDNERAKGDLEIITETNPTGGPLFGITYNVTEVKVNDEGSYEKIGETTYLEGSNDTINTSFAEMKDIYSGYYLVEQVTVPEGWQKDLPQIVEVPSYNIGYATFEITEMPKMAQNKVVINKEILNSSNNKATTEDFEKAELNENESFEVKITNVDTNEVYYSFISANESGIILGLDAGTYEIEEVYKPKYTTKGYYIVEEVINSNSQLPELVENEIIPSDNKYLFTIEQNGDIVQDVNITIKNIINTDFGFGGQDQKSNYSKVDVEDSINLATRAVIYVVDENNNAISGVKFQLKDEQNNIVSLINNGTEFEIHSKKMIIKGLPVGKYTLVNTACPSGYLKPEDKEIIVYQDAVQVAKIEVQKNIPRGSLTLSTVYKTDEGETKYTSRSKYKVVNTATGELVTFAKTATGNYRKTNLEGASPLVVLKSGKVEVEGLEPGTYEVGLVDVTKGFGIQNNLPETITVNANAKSEVSVEVISKNVVQVEAGFSNNMYLDESGNLYVFGDNTNGSFGFQNDDFDGTSVHTKIDFGKDVKITKFSQSYYSSVLAVDTEGKVWCWGRPDNKPTPVCITDEDTQLNNEYYNEGTRFVDVLITDETKILLDNKGRVWTSGLWVGDGTSNTYSNYICLSNIEGTALAQSFENGVTIEKLADYTATNSKHFGLIDSEGKVWVWGSQANFKNLGFAHKNSVLSPVCLSEDSDLKDVKIESLTMTDMFSIALDENGNVWLWGEAGQIQFNTTGKYQPIPTIVDSSKFGGCKIVKVAANSASRQISYALVIDELGRVWTWGSAKTGELGNGATGIMTAMDPVCLSDNESEALYGIKMKDIDTCFDNSYNGHIIAVDTNNKLWAWGGFSSKYGITGPESQTAIATPITIPYSYNEHLEYNLKFKEVYTNGTMDGGSSFAIDEEGRVWSWGYNEDTNLGYSTYGNWDDNILIPKLVEVPGNAKIKKIAVRSHTTMMLSEDGRVFICGKDYYNFSVKDSLDPILLTEITEQFNLSFDEKIVDIYNSNGTFIALDSSGKVYTWGSKYGRDTSQNASEIVCISNDNNALNGNKITKITSYYNDKILLDEQGKVYGWGDSYIKSATPICLTDKITKLNEAYQNNIKIVDVCGFNLIDSRGMLSHIDIDGGYTCLGETETTPFFELHKQDSNYRIVKMYKTSEADVIVKDSNGDLWCVDYNNNVTKFEGEVVIDGYTVKADLLPENISSLSEYLLIDDEGKIWVYKNINNRFGEAGNGTTIAIEEPICIINRENYDDSTSKGWSVIRNQP